ncbi:MAG: hypothetical protein QXE22_01380, partial [Candidatus Bathyarchaeia archaeon]
RSALGFPGDIAAEGRYTEAEADEPQNLKRNPEERHEKSQRRSLVNFSRPLRLEFRPLLDVLTETMIDIREALVRGGSSGESRELRS